MAMNQTLVLLFFTVAIRLGPSIGLNGSNMFLFKRRFGPRMFKPIRVVGDPSEFI